MLTLQTGRSWFSTAVVCSIALALAGLSGCKKADSPDAAGVIDTRAIAEEAVIYGYPLVANYTAVHGLTIDKASSQYKGPFNFLANEARVFTYKDTAIVTPNSDTPYSLLSADLRAEPMVICVPAVPKDRYYSVQLVDWSTYIYGYIGSRATGNDKGCFMIAGPKWSGQTPKGITKVFRSGSDFSFNVFRTQLFNAADMPNVVKIQAGYKVQPLSAYLGTPAPAAAPEIDWPDVDAAKAKTDFLSYLAFVLPFINDPKAAGVRANLAKIGVIPGQPFDMSKLSEVDKAAVLVGMKQGMDKIEQKAKVIGRDENGWHVADAFGDSAFYDGDWLLRAAAAKAGIYGNAAEEALYPLAAADNTGAKLDGSKFNYTITFAKDAFPPVNAFWSVTMYDGKTQLLIKNPIGRYLINSPMLPSMKTNADGSLTMYLSATSPGADKEANWLPAPDGPIYAVMRLYWPKEAALKRDWKPPVIQQVAK